MSWRTPIYRWNWRMLRVERKQWALIVGMIATVVALGVFAVTAGFNVANRDDLRRGNATHTLTIDTSEADDATTVARSVGATVDVVDVAQVVPLGSATPVPVRSFDPDGVNVAPLIALVDGRYPAESGELAATPHQLDRLGLALGGTITLDGAEAEIVGIVENPRSLSDEFFFAPSGVLPAQTTQLFINGSDDQVARIVDVLSSVGIDGSGDDGTATSVMLATLVAAALLEVALLAIAVITVLAQRRVRHLGMLAAIGAGQRQVRAAVIAGGVVAGVLSVGLGVAVGLAAALGVVPMLDTLADRRITSVEVPWVVIGVVAAMAFTAAVAAAWWPARKMARLSVARSLRARRPEAPRPVKTTIAGVALIGLGVASLVAVFSMSPARRPIFVDVVATVAVPLGAVLLSPMVVRLWVRMANRRRLTARVAAADIGRYQARSAATVAALVIILVVPVVFAVGFRTVEQSPDNVPTMPGHFAMVTESPAAGDGFGAFSEGPVPITESSTGLDVVHDEVAAIAASVGAEAIRLTQPVGSAGGPPHPLTAGIIEERSGDDVSVRGVPAYLITADLAAALGVATDLDGHDVVTNRPGNFAVVDFGTMRDRLVEGMDVALAGLGGRYSDSPGALLSPAFVEAQGWSVTTTGWLLVGATDFTDAQLVELARAAGAIGLAAAGSEPGIRGDGVVPWVLAGAALVAVAAVAIVGALHRAETSDVDVAYQALGASRSFRRTVHSRTIAGLVAMAAVLATVAGVLSQVGFAKETLGVGELWRMIPPVGIAGVLVGIPAIAYGVTWLTTTFRTGAAVPQRQFG